MQHQIRKYALFLLLLFIGSSCQKKYTCSYSYNYLTLTAAFAGYSSSELREVVFQKFQADGNFSSLISTDTVDCSAAVFQGDTAYLSIAPYFYGGFFAMDDQSDYKIKVLSGGNREYAIRLRNNGKLSETWTQTTHCSPGAGVSRMVPYNVILNGAETQPFAKTTNVYSICLRR